MRSERQPHALPPIRRARHADAMARIAPALHMAFARTHLPLLRTNRKPRLAGLSGQRATDRQVDFFLTAVFFAAAVRAVVDLTAGVLVGEDLVTVGLPPTTAGTAA